MSDSILWTCCKCVDSIQTICLTLCWQCHHQWCEGCSLEFHGPKLLRTPLTSNSFETTIKLEPGGTLCGTDDSDACTQHGGIMTNNIDDDEDDDNDWEFQDSHVTFNSLNLHAATSIPNEVPEIDRQSPESGMKMEIDAEGTAEDFSMSEKEVKLRKKIISQKFQEISKKFNNLARSNGTEKQQKLSPYFEQLKDPTCFAFAWERCVLPLFLEFAPRWLGSTYTINVLQGPTSGSRIIVFMSGKELGGIRQSKVKQHVFDMLPNQFHRTTSFQFSVGSVERLCGRRGTSKSDEDFCEPRNPFYYSKPTMGDSIGPPDDSNVATLGPCLNIDGKGYWLASFHLFQSAFPDRKWPNKAPTMIHPAFADQDHCEKVCHGNRHDKFIRLGDIKAVSGCDWTPTRISREAESLELENPYRVVVDWVLARADEPMPNLVRVQNIRAEESCRHVTSIDDVVPGAPVFSTGRSSGVQFGKISLSPAVVSGGPEGNGTGVETREWSVHRPYPDDGSLESDELWATSGIGVGGDSGAPIIDSCNNSLYGMVWGRNAYFGQGQRIAYFTDINDIFDHIKEKYEQYGDIKLPQCDGNEQPTVPACPGCYERQQQLETTEQVRSVGSEPPLNSGSDLADFPQDTNSEDSLTARLGSPSRHFDNYADLVGSAEDFSYFEMNTEREHSVPQSSTNLADDMSELRSPMSILSPHPRIQQNWLAGMDHMISSGDPFWGIPHPMSLDDNDLLERSDSGSSAEDSDKNARSASSDDPFLGVPNPMGIDESNLLLRPESCSSTGGKDRDQAPQKSEAKHSLTDEVEDGMTYDLVSCEIKVGKKRKI